ncbi:MAG TPA: hypothetical protein PLA77_10780, partial [Bacteroidales bacterium]|nr:hypothetical protein [Bacteroidales bacterium]
MKTSSSARSLVCVAIVFIIAGATSCSSYKSLEGDRLYYDFKTKQLHQDSAAGEVISRPIKVKENNEIQLEVFHFNPLKHNIRFKET